MRELDEIFRLKKSGVKIGYYVMELWGLILIADTVHANVCRFVCKGIEKKISL
jgi:hypothetical protein